jgi:hypothetical protein
MNAPGWPESIDPQRLLALLHDATPPTRHGAPAPEIQRLLGGANNAVFRVEWAGQAFLLKQYFAHPQDPRDRFGAEIAFVRFAAGAGIQAVPRLLAAEPALRLALFEWIDGRRVQPEEIDDRLIAQAADFCRRLIRARDSDQAAGLPAAAEAYFSLNQHLACVGRRIDRLAAAPVESDLDREVQLFVRDDLSPLWCEVYAAVVQSADSDRESLYGELRRDERWVSPSDFGFHNALLEPGGRLRFFDFEYAGWDDPAKLLCDFRCQVEVPVPKAMWEAFRDLLLESLPRADGVAWRVARLLPVYRLKWCCIALNEFLPEVRRRRSFSAADTRDDRRAEAQLAKARQILEAARRESSRS